MVEIIAETTTNHMGNLNALLRMADLAKAAGADWIKVQKKDVECFYSKEKLDKPFPSPYGQTYRDYRTMFEFAGPDFQRFHEHCQRIGLRWFSTAQDVPSLEFFLRHNWFRRYKVASSNARNKTFLKTVAEIVPTECEIVVSVAGSALAQIDETLRVFDSHSKVWLLHCVAEYPCPTCRCRLGNIAELRRRFACDRVHVGYSGHEEGWGATLAAVAMGAEMVERHFCLSRHSFVHHIECSLEPCEFAEMAKQIRNIEADGTAPPAPDGACKTAFGMSAVERKFLVEQSYGNTYMGDSSVIR